MCGIVGHLVPGGFPREEGLTAASAMADTIAHRGPDDRGVWLDSDAGVALGHRRLSVIDLSAAGRQPMTSPSGRYVIVFNGEIYNHNELREAALRTGGEAIAWKGTSDTESFLVAMERLGVKTALQAATGMFAFGLWDRSRRCLYLGRDRLGEKPVHFGWQRGTFLFASELKALAAHPCFDGCVDREALLLFLRHGYVPSPWSIYRGIRKLTPGSFVKIDGAAGTTEARRVPEEKRYWSLEEVAGHARRSPFTGDSKEAVEAVLRVVGRAVTQQMIADVPLGAFLSGGIDSSTIAALMQEGSSRRIRTFTIGFEDARFDEAQQARAVAEHLGTEHTEMLVRASDALEIIPRLPTLYDEPFADPSQIPTALVCGMTRRHVTVALSGDGGDELFGGYRRYLRMDALWGAASRVPRPMRRLAGKAIGAIPRSWGAGWRPADRARRLARVLPMSTACEMYHAVLSHWWRPSDMAGDAVEPRTDISHPPRWTEGRGLQSQLMGIDAVTYLPDDILVKVDRAAMSVSLETRAPFLDHHVVELAWSLPLSMKIRDGQGKWVLREVLHRFVPRGLVERPKQGFGIPLGSWLRGPLRDWAESLLDDKSLREGGFIDPVPVRKVWNEHLTGRAEWAIRIWDVLMFQAWLAEYRRGSGRCG